MPTTRRRPRHKQILWDLLEDESSPRKKIVDFVVGALIVISVGVFLYILSTPERNHPILEPLEWAVVGVFAVEYLLRFYVASDFLDDIRRSIRRGTGSYGGRALAGVAGAVGAKVRFVFEPIHIIDLLALLPSLRVFRVARLFRLIRLLHLVSYRSSLSSVIGVFREHAYELLVVFAFVIVVLIVAGTGMFLVEHENPHFQSLGDTFWWAIVTMTTVGYGDTYPVTATGRVLASITMMAGICVIALPTAIVTSALMDKVNRLKEGTLQMQNLRGHLLICGLTPATDMIVREIERLDSRASRKTDIVVIAAFSERLPPPGVLLKRGDFTREAVLREAGADKAGAVVIIAERRTPDTPDETIDARTTLAALIADSINPEGRLVAEVLELETTQILRRKLPRLEVIESGALAPRLMAAGAVHRGVGQIVKELLLTTEGNDFYEVEATEAVIARAPSFGDLFRPLRAKGAIPISVRRGLEVHTNPPDEYALAPGDVIVVIAHEPPEEI